MAVEEGTEELYDRLMGTNLKGTWMGCHYAVPEMKQIGGGAIINIASVHGVAGWDRQSVYAATKGGIIAGSRALAVELAPFYIRVNVISPGAIRVRDPVDWVVQEMGEEFRTEFLDRFGDRQHIDTILKVSQFITTYWQETGIMGCRTDGVGNDFLSNVVLHRLESPDTAA